MMTVRSDTLRMVLTDGVPCREFVSPQTVLGLHRQLWGPYRQFRRRVSFEGAFPTQGARGEIHSCPPSKFGGNSNRNPNRKKGDSLSPPKYASYPAGRRLSPPWGDIGKNRSFARKTLSYRRQNGYNPSRGVFAPTPLMGLGIDIPGPFL